MDLLSGSIFFAVACGAAAVVYGAVAARWVLALPAGSERMQEIAKAIQEGARAFLNRQYTTIAGVGLVLLVILWGALGA
jgi:K(+)-stimulated pyrophosphate-energized sodium pump